MEFFKFCKLDTWAIKNIYKSQLFFSDVENLNDAGECLFRVVDDISEDVDKRGVFLDNVKDIVVAHGNSLHENFSTYYKRAKNNGLCYKEVAIYIVAATLESYKTCSFTTKEGFFNPIMWGHYGNSSKGLCLRYDIKSEHFKSIKYIDEKDVEEVFLSEISVGRLGNIAERIFYKKIKDWSYEKEHRLIGKEMIKKVPRECLTGVFFGSNVDESDASFLLDIILEKYCNVDMAITYHPRVNNKMLNTYFNDKETFVKKLRRIKAENTLGTRYLVEEALREALEIKTNNE